MKNVGINGISGRIGKFAAYELVNLGEIIAAANDLATTDQIIESLAHRDSVHGKLDWTVEKTGDNEISINGNKVALFHEKDPSCIAWGDSISAIAECTGAYTTKEGAEKHYAKAPNLELVVVSAPGKNMESYAMGVNHLDYRGDERVVSNASCTTKAIAVPLKVLMDAGCKIYGVYMDTVHAATNTQKPLDFMDAYGSLDIIGSAKTGAAIATAELIPELAGRMEGLAFRVPTRDGSFANVYLVADAPESSVAFFNDAFKAAAEDSRYCGRLLPFAKKEIASPDIIGETASSVLALSKTRALELPYQAAAPGLKPVFVNFISGYDNERGPSKDLAMLVQYALAK